MRPANEAPTDDVRVVDVDDLRVETADDDEAGDDEAGEHEAGEHEAGEHEAGHREAGDHGTREPSDVQVVVRPTPRRAPRLNHRHAAATTESAETTQPAKNTEPAATTKPAENIEDANPLAAPEGEVSDESRISDIGRQRQPVAGLEVADSETWAEREIQTAPEIASEPETASEIVSESASETATEKATEAATEKATEAATEKATEATTEKAVGATTGKATEATTGTATEQKREDEPPKRRAGAQRQPRVVQAGNETDAATQPPDLLSAVERLRTHAATLSLTLEVGGVGDARKERESMISQLDDYALPRLRRKDAPLLAVIGGSTGAGKSTLTNSILRREVTRSGVLRPTTRSPVLVHHPYDSGAFMSQRILPRLNRITSEGAEPLQPIDPNAPRITGLRLVPHDGMPPGMAIIDAPDIDSLVETNRDLAVQLLAAADLWIFVTTAARYADAMPWQMLRQAADRGVAVAVVLDRVPPEALADLRVHLATRLRDRGLGGAPLFVIPETETVNGFLPESAVASLQQWLRRVAGDERSRSVIAARTLKGVLGSLPERALVLADAADAQTLAWQGLTQEIDAVFGPAREKLLREMINGSLVSGEVLARWQEFVADGEFVRRIEGSSGSLAERLRAAVQRDGEVSEPLDVPVTQAAVAAIRASVTAATDAVVARWRRHPHGAALLEARGHQLTPDDALDVTLERTVRDWRVIVSGGVTAAVQAVEGGRVDEETAADVVFMVAIDERADASQSEGQSAEVVSVAAAGRILARLVGDEAVRHLAAEARADLVTRAAVVLDAERQRLERLLVGTGTTARGDSLRIAAAVLREAR